jgi:serine/threonine protein kinase
MSTSVVELGSFAVKNGGASGGLIQWRGVAVSEKGALKLDELERTDEPVAWAGPGTRKWRRPGGEHVVVRMLPLTDKKLRDAAMRELETLWELKSHRNVVSFLGAAYSEADAALAVGLEYTDGGSLSELLRRARLSLPELMVARIVRQIVDGLIHLHTRKIIHRRLTPDTVLVTHAGDIKITDFELAKLGGDSAELMSPATKRGDGIPRGEATYAAPEWLAGEAHTSNVDIYSLGVIAVDLATGRLALDEQPTPAADRRGPPTLDPALHSPSLCDFVARCYWTQDIRPSSTQTLMHPFVQQHTGLSDLRLADSSVPSLTKEIVLEFLHHYYQHLTEALADGSEADLAVRKAHSTRAALPRRP